MSISYYFTRPHAVERRHQGVLGPYVDLYAARLSEQGFLQETGEKSVRVASDFGVWLQRCSLGLPDICEATIDRFLKDRAQTLLPNRAERPALLRCLTLLRQISVVSPAVLVASTERQRIQGDFRDHLLQEAGLSPRSVARYLPYIRRCLSEWFGNRPLDWTTLCAADVIDYVRRHAHEHGSRHAQLMVTAMRSFFRYLRFRGDITVDLAASVPAVARWKLATLPPSLSAKQVRDMLSHCDRQSRVGRRDYAILLLASRLGLRSREVIELKLDDVDWREGEIVIRGKGNQVSRAPLPWEVGEAIAAYLKNDRPSSTDRHLFLKELAPHTGFASHASVFWIVKNAMARANVSVPRGGAHLFRHTLATQMLRRGASLFEVGQVLRHQHPDTTRIYAKVDVRSLRSLGLAWPGGAR